MDQVAKLSSLRDLLTSDKEGWKRVNLMQAMFETSKKNDISSDLLRQKAKIVKQKERNNQK